MPHYGYGSIQELKEDQRQTHASCNINYYHQCTMNVNSFNAHNTTMEDCYNNIPVTRSYFFPPSLHILSSYNLKITILLLETSTFYPSRLTVRISFSTAAALAVSCMLAIYLCGKGVYHLHYLFYQSLFDNFSSHIMIPLPESMKSSKQRTYTLFNFSIRAFLAGHPFVILNMQNCIDGYKFYFYNQGESAVHWQDCHNSDP